jgi:site-specific DNA-methyltransferase (adenine-specific)
MKIETLAIADLIPDPQNARQHDDKNIKAIEGSLSQFGQRKPIVITEAGVIVAGNGTVKAAKSLGWTHIEVVQVPADWSKDQVKAFALADNRTAELATWAPEVLAAQLIELDSAGFEIAQFGFDKVESPIDPDSLAEDEIPEPPAQPITKLGDLWQLGKHRLLCGDSLDSKNIELLLSGNDIEVLITDPPYGMDFISNHRKEKHKAIANDGNTKALVFSCNLEAKHSKYIFCRWDNLADVPKPTSLITWVKNNWSMGDLQHSHARQTETILFYPGKNHVFADGRPSDVVNEARTNNELHPTQKPIELLAQIMQWTKGSVLDIFAGSGATLMAAEKLKRDCYAIELDPKYCDVIIKRWENLTGLKAELLNATR